MGKLRSYLPTAGLVAGGVILVALLWAIVPYRLDRGLITLFGIFVIWDGWRRYQWNYVSYYAIFVFAFCSLHALQQELSPIVVAIASIAFGYSIVSARATTQAEKKSWKVRTVFGICLAELISLASLIPSANALTAGIITLVGVGLLESLPYGRRLYWKIGKPYFIVACSLLAMLIVTLWLLPN